MSKLRLLVAYPYMAKSVMDLLVKREEEIQLLLDSGAFTAWKAGREINVHEYIKFIKNLPVKPWKYFALDVIGNAEATRTNYQLMLDAGLKPIPIFTRGENPDILDEYYKTSDVVGIGGLVGTQGNKGFVKGIMGLVGDRRVHLLGFTGLDFLKAYRPYMADSSSWEMGARFAACPLYLGKGRPLVSLRKGTIVKQLQDPLIVEAIEAIKLNPSDFLKNDNWAGGRSIARITGARSMRRYSDDIYDNLGTNLFLAASTNLAIELVLGD